MNDPWPIHLIQGVGLFSIGTVVGSFLNVCIYRIPWEQSVIWPGSRCPKCLAAIETRDNIPVLGWLLLRGKCRGCGTSISPRYPAIELLVGLLFLAVYAVDALSVTNSVRDDSLLLLRVLFHVLLVAFLVAITFIDADLTIVPSSITNLGIVTGLALGAAVPEVRLEPAAAATAWSGLWVGLKGLIVGGGLIQFTRVVGGFVFRREAMGSGDIHILGLIGVFLGWQAAILTFFLAPFFGFLPALWKLTVYLGKILRGRKSLSTDRELPFGPFLALAALTWMFSWRWSWPGFAKSYFETLSVLFWFLLGQEG